MDGKKQEMVDVGRTPGASDDDIVAAYLANKKIPDIEREFGVGKTTIYHVLRRSGQLPSRSKRRVEGASRDAAISGLYELIGHQDRAILQRDAEIETLNKRVRSLERKLKAAGTAASNRVASKRSTGS